MQLDAERAALRAARAICPDDLAALDRGASSPAVQALQAALRELRGEAEEGGPKARLHPVQWLASVYRRHDRRRPVGQVAARLAVLDPQGEALTLKGFVKALHLPQQEVVAALFTLEKEGFISTFPSARIGAKEITLIR